MPSCLARWIVPALWIASAFPAALRTTAALAETGSSGTKASSVVTATSLQGRWYVAETKNFYVCSDESASYARRLAEGAEAQRAALRTLWLGSISDETWTPRCHVVLHSTRQGYVAAVGRGGQWTIGSSLVHADDGKVTGRRIDLIGGQTAFLTEALPHELTHVVLRDRFPAAALPHWADEGTAVLADASEKQFRHARDLQQALAGRSTFHAAELLNVGDYPEVGRLGTFYGQSASLVKFLVAREGHARFVDFLDHAAEHGYDAALAEHYSIEGVQDLDRQWRSQVDAEQIVDRTQLVPAKLQLAVGAE
jgi:hypothetical protein